MGGGEDCEGGGRVVGVAGQAGEGVGGRVAARDEEVRMAVAIMEVRM